MSNNKQIEKPLELPHQETIVGTNTIQTKPFDNQKTMSNNKQTSIDWFFDQLVFNRIIIINGTTYWDKVKTKYEILLEQAREMYQDEIEAAIIKNCATESTSEASQYASGYSSGYERALEMVKWKIDNELRSK
jgi:hypothetical protein